MSSLFSRWHSALILQDAVSEENNIFSSPTHFTTTKPTDTEVWSKLPFDLVARILAHLPIVSRIHTRVIRKKWDREINCGQILGCLPCPGYKSWLFLCDNRGTGEIHNVYAYCPWAGQWYPMELDSLPHFSVEQSKAGWRLCAAAGGLLCYTFCALEAQFVGLCVCNPITKSWKRLPPLNFKREKPIVAMLVDSSFKSYKIVVAGGVEYDEQVVSTEVYCSRTEEWRVSSYKCINHHNHVLNSTTSSTVHCNGDVYHLRFNQILALSDPTQGNWQLPYIHAPPPPPPQYVVSMVKRLGMSSMQSFLRLNTHVNTFIPFWLFSYCPTDCARSSSIMCILSSPWKIRQIVAHRARCIATVTCITCITVHWCVSTPEMLLSSPYNFHWEEIMPSLHPKFLRVNHIFKQVRPIWKISYCPT